jgi:alpha-amylase/alpha-mannosidase (GH57 family)
MKFGEALELLRIGEKITCDEFKNKIHAYLRLINLENDSVTSEFIAMFFSENSKEIMIPWCPTSQELLSENWEIL